MYDWRSLGDEHASAGWAHHGLAVGPQGQVIAFDAGSDEVLVFGPGGGPPRRWASGLTEGHGITAVVDGDGECVWIADPGQKMRPSSPGTYRSVTSGDHGRVVKFTLEGRLVRELPVPPLPVYEDHRYSPTAVVVEAGPGESGRVWVADGYGQSLVHLFSAGGGYLHTLTGELKCPHGLFIDRRRAEPELYVADRENGRIQVYGLDGQFRRTLGEGVLRRPSAIAVAGQELVVAELEARLAIFGPDDGFVRYVGADDDAPSRAGWPNAETPDGRTVRPALHPGRFNSPHGLAVDADGNPVVAEWLIGGRVTRLVDGP